MFLHLCASTDFSSSSSLFMLSACFVSNPLEALKSKPQPEEVSHKVPQEKHDEAKIALKVKDKTPEVVPEKKPERRDELLPEKVPQKVVEEKKMPEKIPVKVQSEKPDKMPQKEAEPVKVAEKTEKKAEVKQPQAADEALRKGTAKADLGFLLCVLLISNSPPAACSQ